MSPKPTFSFREATEEDIPVLRQFEQGVVSAERAFTDRLIAGPIQYYDMQAIVKSESACMLIACAEGTPIGCGLARIEEGKPHFSPRTYAYLGCMYVDPDWRGQGVIQGLIEALFSWSEANGVSAYKLDVFAKNSGAIRAYEKLGFRAELIEMVRQ